MTVPDGHSAFAAIAALVESEPLLTRLSEAAGKTPVYLVGGAVRDALMGRDGGGHDLDLALDGPVEPVAREVDPDAVIHERFETATVRIAERTADIARTRRERYPQPGALPVVEPAPIEEDLGRRDFTINAMAVRTDEPEALIDPHGGRSDIERSVLRVLHDRSFIDDPTRALRAARYAARFGFDVEPLTADLLRGADLSLVSRDRIENELALIADEPTAVEAVRLASAWRLLDLNEARLELLASALAVVSREPWTSIAGRREVLRAVVAGTHEPAHDRNQEPASATEAVDRAERLGAVGLVLARASGADWPERYVNDWRGVTPEITGEDLLRAGIPRGAAIGAGLRAALEARLDAGLTGREAQLEVALAASRRALAGGPSA